MILFFIFLIGSLITFLYVLLGPFITLLKNAFFIDAVGHSIVFGVAVGFLLSHSLNSPLLLICAILSSLLMNLIHSIFQKQTIIANDASLGIAFSTLFSLGILLISLYGKNIHLDLDMILLGNIEYALYDSIFILNMFIPKIIIILIISIFFFLLFLYFFWTQLQLLLFDTEFAYVKGIYKRTIYYLFLFFASSLIVMTFNVMGSLLLLGISVSSFGYSWHSSHSFSLFLIKSIFLALFFSSLGILISLYSNISIAASISFFITSSSLLFYFIQVVKKR